MIITKEWIANPPMPLSGPQNLRELGGYPTVHGIPTAKGRLLRSDGLQNLTRSDKEILFGYGVRTVIDLRSNEEAEKEPEGLDDFPAVKCFHYPMFSQCPAQGGGWRDPDTLAELYIALLEDMKGAIREVMRTISQAGDGCVLFHCAVGKDRTGIIAMLLLLLAGVPDDVVIADYSSSCDNMAVIFARQKLLMHVKGIPVNEKLFRSSQTDIEAAMEHVYEHYGDAEGYLIDIGCTGPEIDSLHRRILHGGHKATLE